MTGAVPSDVAHLDVQIRISTQVVARNAEASCVSLFDGHRYWNLRVDTTMETALWVAFVGAVGAEIASVLPVILKHQIDARNRRVGTQTHDEPKLNEFGLVNERTLRSHRNVQRLLANKSLKATAEAAIAYFVLGTECPINGWKNSSTWQQVKQAYADLASQ